MDIMTVWSYSDNLEEQTSISTLMQTQYNDAIVKC